MVGPDATPADLIDGDHARHLIVTDTAAPWPVEDFGVPINQEDLLGTLMTFTWLILDGLNRLGVTLTAQDQQTYLETWLVARRWASNRRCCRAPSPTPPASPR